MIGFPECSGLATYAKQGDGRMTPQIFRSLVDAEIIEALLGGVGLRLCVCLTGHPSSPSALEDGLLDEL